VQPVFAVPVAVFRNSHQDLSASQAPSASFGVVASSTTSSDEIIAGRLLMIRSGFEAYKDGFQFTNGHFDFYVGPANCTVLCGGISYAALDYWFTKFKPPVSAKTPADGNPLQAYLYRRQMTAHYYTWNRFVSRWLGARDSADEIKNNIDVIASRCVAKKPSVICLVGDFSHGHHVLATGVDPTTQKLEIYDSNWPGGYCTLTPQSDGTWKHSDKSVWNTWFSDGGYDQNGGPQLPVVPFEFCRTCHGMVCTGFRDRIGMCTNGGVHDLMVPEYFLPMDSSTGEGGWFLCNYCLSMFSNDGANAGGWCSNGGKHQAKPGWPEMSVCVLGRGKGDHSWRQCNSCLTLNWGAGADAACPAGGKHDNAGSTKYVCDSRVIEKS